jgi:hypothetical protein
MKNSISLLITAFILLVSLNLTGQTWRYEESGNAFDGKYKTAYVKGKGGKFPYETPTFVVNRFNDEYSLNLYFSGVGYAGCENNYIKIKFDSEEPIYMYFVNPDKANETWFIDKTLKDTDLSVNMYALLDKMRTHTTMHVRVGNDCFTHDYSFPLSGSTKAINFVAKDLIEKGLAKIYGTEQIRVDD